MVERRTSSDGRDKELSSCALGVKSFGANDREAVNEVKRGRIYDNVDGWGGGGAGGFDGRGGGNHLVNDSRTQSEVT